MVAVLRAWYRNRSSQPWVRPWGLAMPILVLIVCLPLLRPLWVPEINRISENEMERLATIQAIVEQKTLAIDKTSLARASEHPIGVAEVDGVQESRRYSRQPLTFAAMLAGPYWLMHHFGLTFDANPVLTAYMLTLLGAAVPVALAAGLVYRLGRLFELPRHWRMALSGAAVFGSGLISYGTVLNAHAPAAALLLGGLGCMYHAITVRQRAEAFGWLVLAGLVVGLAAVIDLGAVVFLLLLPGALLAVRWPASIKVAGITWYIVGAIPPLVLHAVLTVPVSGDIRPLFLHPELTHEPAHDVVMALDDEGEDTPAGMLLTGIVHLRDGLVGPRGLLIHFPVLILGLWGATCVVRRNWPSATKLLAVLTVASAILVVGAYAILNADWQQPMFSIRWFVLFMPVLVYWAGAWLRHHHRPAAWAVAGILLGFSVLTSLIGATDPFTPAGPGEYTAYTAARDLFRHTDFPSGGIAHSTARGDSEKTFWRPQEASEDASLGPWEN